MCWCAVKRLLTHSVKLSSKVNSTKCVYLKCCLCCSVTIFFSESTFALLRTPMALLWLSDLAWSCIFFGSDVSFFSRVSPCGGMLPVVHSLGSFSRIPADTSSCQPSYLYNLLQVYHPSRALHSSTQQLLYVPYMSTDYGRHAFSYSSPATWNSIPISIKNCSSLYSFKRHLKSYFIAQLTNN